MSAPDILFLIDEKVLRDLLFLFLAAVKIPKQKPPLREALLQYLYFVSTMLLISCLPDKPSVHLPVSLRLLR